MNDLLLEQFLIILRLFNTANSSEFKIVIDFVSITHLVMHHIRNIGVTFKIIVHFISIIITKTSGFIFARLQRWLFIPEFVLNAHVAECCEHGAHAFAKASLQLVCRHVQINAESL